MRVQMVRPMAAQKEVQAGAQGLVRAAVVCTTPQQARRRYADDAWRQDWLLLVSASHQPKALCSCVRESLVGRCENLLERCVSASCWQLPVARTGVQLNT